MLPPRTGRLSAFKARAAEAFIRARLPITEVPRTGLRLHLAGPQSGLSRLVPPGGMPFWAYAWPGGVALALHLAANPEAVRGRAILDLGPGSGLVCLAALRAGASVALALDTDPLAAVATNLNAEANGLPAPLVHIEATDVWAAEAWAHGARGSLGRAGRGCLLRRGRRAPGRLGLGLSPGRPRTGHPDTGRRHWPPLPSP